MAIAQLAGQRFDNLLVIELVEVTRARGALWLCRCDCGGEVVKATRELKRGAWAQRCRRCTSAVLAQGPARTHGESDTRLWRVWSSMRERCRNPNHPHWMNYGGKGVAVCPEWNDFTAFKAWALAAGYEYREGPRGDRLSIDRINPNGNYEPNNCRWITSRENSRRVHDRPAKEKDHLRKSS